MRVPDPRNCSYGTEDDRNKCHQTQGQNGGVYDIHLLKIIDNFKHKPSNARECTAAVNTPQVLKRRRDSQTEPERWPLLSRSNFFWSILIDWANEGEATNLGEECVEE